MRTKHCILRTNHKSVQKRHPGGRCRDLMLTSVVGKMTAIVILERFGTAWANTPAFFDLARHLPVSMHALITFYVGRAELGISHDLIARLMELAEQADESSLLLLAHEHLGILRYFEGNSSDVLKQFESGSTGSGEERPHSRTSR